MEPAFEIAEKMAIAAKWAANRVRVWQAKKLVREIIGHAGQATMEGSNQTALEQLNRYVRAGDYTVAIGAQREAEIAIHTEMNSASPNRWIMIVGSELASRMHDIAFAKKRPAHTHETPPQPITGPTGNRNLDRAGYIPHGFKPPAGFKP